MFDLLEKYIMGPMTKLSQFRMIRAITFAGMTSISFTIVGSMFLILNVLPQAFPFLAGIWSVSYTHLDVYKRQAKSGLKGPSLPNIQSPMNSSRAVFFYPLCSGTFV